MASETGRNSSGTVGFFYVDHTAFIRELEKYRTPVFLRPRRFGKTMWCSILEYYYDVWMKTGDL